MTSSDPAARDPRIEAATRAFLYGYPLVYNLDEIAKLPAGTATIVPGVVPFNSFRLRAELCGPETEFVSPNTDTIYLVAALDLSGGPLVLQVPDAGDRYYVLQFVDAWSNNVAYLGQRATGTAAAAFLLTPPGWSGTAPAGVSAVIELPTTIALVLGRIAIDGHADLPAVEALGAGFTLTPLPGNGPLRGMDQASPDPAVGGELAWWERFRRSVVQFGTPPSDAPVQPLLDALGVTAGTSPYASPDPGLATALAAGAAAGRALIEQLMHDVPASPTGWQLSTHLFDYNVDFLRIGTIDGPGWRIDDPAKRWATRAVVARAGLWGNHGYEAAYAIAWVDADGQPLDGRHRYELHLDVPPPVDAFWSLTMYDVPRFYLVANPIDRYSVGDRTPGLQVAADGSVTIVIQHEAPDPDRRANWLPAPAGAFRPILRMYLPHAEVLDGRFQLPPIRRIG